MKICLFVFVMLFQVCLCAYEWEPLGPDSLKINNGYIDPDDFRMILCTDEGILTGDFNEPEFVESILPVIDAVSLDDNSMLVVMGGGSNSDGIYQYTPGANSENTFELVEWCYIPNFILHSEEDEQFFVGDDEGLLVSSDGLSWSRIDYFLNKKCTSMDCYDHNLAVTADGTVHFINTETDGLWQESESAWQPYEKLMFAPEGKLYGIFGGESESAGLRSSYDFGANWDVEFWESISALGQDFAGNVFVGSREDWIGLSGAALWLPDMEERVPLNEGLANQNVNNIITFHGIDCAAVIYCTDQGAHYICGYEDLLSIEHEEDEIETTVELSQNYPNPFNPATTISYELRASDYVNLVVHNSVGEKIWETGERKQEAGKYSTEFDGSAFYSGVYFYALNIGGEVKQTRKMILVK